MCNYDIARCWWSTSSTIENVTVIATVALDVVVAVKEFATESLFDLTFQPAPLGLAVTIALKQADHQVLEMRTDSLAERREDTVRRDFVCPP